MIMWACFILVDYYSSYLSSDSESLTDNGNRTIHKLREILNEYGCVIPHEHSVSQFLIAPIFNSGRFAPVMFMFDRVGRVQVTVPKTEDRDSRIEAILEAASSAGGEDFEILEDSTIVEVRNSNAFSGTLSPRIDVRRKLYYSISVLRNH